MFKCTKGPAPSEVWFEAAFSLSGVSLLASTSPACPINVSEESFWHSNTSWVSIFIPLGISLMSSTLFEQCPWLISRPERNFFTLPSSLDQSWPQFISNFSSIWFPWPYGISQLGLTAFQCWLSPKVPLELARRGCKIVNRIQTLDLVSLSSPSVWSRFLLQQLHFCSNAEPSTKRRVQTHCFFKRIQSNITLFQNIFKPNCSNISFQIKVFGSTMGVTLSRAVID